MKGKVKGKRAGERNEEERRIEIGGEDPVESRSDKMVGGGREEALTWDGMRGGEEDDEMIRPVRWSQQHLLFAQNTENLEVNIYRTHIRHPTEHPDPQPCAYSPYTPTHRNRTAYHSSLQILRSQHLYQTRPLLKPGAKDPIRVLKHAVLQTHHNKLTTLEPSLDQPTNILRMAQIQRRIDLIQDIHGRGFELQESEDQGESDEGALATGKFGEGLLPDFAQGDFDLEAVGDGFVFWGVEFGKTAWEQVGEDVAEIVVDFCPGFVEGFFFVFV